MSVYLINPSHVSFGVGVITPRWLYVLPNGDVLVAETNAPRRPEEGKGIRGWVTMNSAEPTRSRSPI